MTSSKEQIQRGNNSYLKCINCGLVFAKTEISRNCPLCAADSENFKPYDENETSD
ncbi:MAG: hypothetical protein IIB00_05060 [candidate division Zixibacteria bacterium]|nr:hypothetical protein [candidate division Zixibacteria bacterium]